MRAWSGLLSAPLPWLDGLPMGPFGATAVRARMAGFACLAPLWLLPLVWGREVPIPLAILALAAAILLFRRGARLARG
ncbi:MAG: hypothetical protein AAF390_02325 [Pseudomonadota bacterium]